MALALLLAYDGTDFHGYQRQAPHREPTVQGVLEAALARLCGAPVATVAAGRTDAGVHATGQVVTCRVMGRSRLAPEDWRRALNALLPESVAVRAATFADDAVSARRAAIQRVYRYRLLVDPVRSPLRERYAWRVSTPLDLAAMQAACRELVGERDFAAFGHSPSDQTGQPRRHTVRDLRIAEVSQAGDETACEFAANAFLTGMVRRMVGTLVQVGTGKLSPADVAGIVAERSKPGPLAPARGLCLVRADFEPGTIVWPADSF
jgi:tRNA pseudouridine38-40 synthase